ncbi:MAG: (2Fe-2S) ferredoxin domain-containing protein [Verrucomicrobia bacterium]|jgi:(2Fe-2S) ferredoxin|nr:(2Fe-2S) ferredoxin domain-containing protein [Verrucomicrobiota bacterium]
MNLEQLKQLKEKAQKQIALREGGKKYRVVVGMGTSGVAAGAREVMTIMLDEIEKQSLGSVEVCVTGEIGMVDAEPMVRVEETGGEKTVYGKVDRDSARKIVTQHLQKGKKVQEIAVGQVKNKE